jgi:hypothetical protein
MKCKNIECDNETTGKRIYCSLSCRNIFVNKYLRSYNKVSNTFKQKKKEKEEQYLLDPKICKECGKIITFEFKDNTYCNSSCMASYTNRLKNVTWGDNIRKGVCNYLIKSGIKKEGEIGKYNLVCKGCGIKFQNKRSEIKYCSSECRKSHRRKNMDEYQKYRLDTNFNFNLSDYKDEFDFSLIEKYGWYSPSNKNNNLGGISRDHMLSVREGFEMKIDPKIISHPANCRLMIHNENISKNKRSIISLEELLERIRIFEEKYKN